MEDKELHASIFVLVAPYLQGFVNQQLLSGDSLQTIIQNMTQSTSKNITTKTSLYLSF